MKPSNLVLGLLTLFILGMNSCSDNDNPISDPPAESASGYYFSGTIRLTDIDTGKPVYEIRNRLAMLPNAYGYDIPIPIPNASVLFIEVSLPGCNIETSDAVEWESNGEIVTADFPSEGTTVYNKALSITRTSDTSFEITFTPIFTVMADDYSNGPGNTNFRILANPKLEAAWSDGDTGIVFKSEDELKNIHFPQKIGLRLYPYTFSDFYRPFWQPGMIVF